MKHYTFKIELSGSGETPDEAWRDAVEGFQQEPGATPEEFAEEELTEEDAG